MSAKVKVKKVRVEVTERDILLGRRNNAGECPVARAVQRYLCEPALCASALYCEWNWRRRAWPKRVMRFIKQFDAGETVRPFTFLFPRPSDWE